HIQPPAKLAIGDRGKTSDDTPREGTFVSSWSTKYTSKLGVAGAARLAPLDSGCAADLCAGGQPAEFHVPQRVLDHSGVESERTRASLFRLLRPPRIDPGLYAPAPGDDSAPKAQSVPRPSRCTGRRAACAPRFANLTAGIESVPRFTGN